MRQSREQHVTRAAPRAFIGVAPSLGRPISGLSRLRLNDVLGKKKESAGIPASAFQAAATLYGKTVFKVVASGESPQRSCQRFASKIGPKPRAGCSRGSPPGDARRANRGTWAGPVPADCN